jgi:hypothetical protein
VRVTVSFTEFREIEDPIPQKITETLDITSGERYVQLPGNTKGINSVEVILSDDKKIILTTPEPSNGFYYEYNPTTKGIVLRMIQ